MWQNVQLSKYICLWDTLYQLKVQQASKETTNTRIQYRDDLYQNICANPRTHKIDALYWPWTAFAGNCSITATEVKVQGSGWCTWILWTWWRRGQSEFISVSQQTWLWATLYHHTLIWVFSTGILTLQCFNGNSADNRKVPTTFIPWNVYPHQWQPKWKKHVNQDLTTY